MYDSLEGFRAFKFSEAGDSVSGLIVGDREVAERDFKTKEEKTFPDGSKRMQLVLDLQTNLREDQDDDGMRRVYLTNKAYKAFRSAFKASKAKLPFRDAGALSELKLSVRLLYTHQEASRTRGQQGAKHFEVALWGGPLNAKVVARSDDDDGPPSSSGGRTQAPPARQAPPPPQRRQQAAPPPDDDVPPADDGDIPF